MIEFKTFKALVNIYEKCQIKCDSFSKKMEKLFDQDTSIMFYWPLEFCAKQIKSVLISEFGETLEGADWFIYEALPDIKDRKGTEIGVAKTYENVKDESKKVFTYYKIKSLEDYFNFLKKDYAKLKSSLKSSNPIQEKDPDLQLKDDILYKGWIAKMHDTN